MFHFRRIGFLAGLVLVAACSQGPMGTQWQSNTGNSGQSSSGAVSLNNNLLSQAMTIINANCVSCHTSASGPLGVYGLTDINHLVSSGLVIPGQPTQSSLYNAIAAGRMPPAGRLSSADEILIQDWILGGSGPAPGGTTTTTLPLPTVATFSSLEHNVFQPRCVGCHSSFSAAGGFAFDSYSGVMRAVNKTTPSSSKIYTITTSGAMPPSGPRLTSQEESLILQWIQAGALNN